MDLKKLKAEWYAKLKAEGFNDIEYEGGDLLKGGSSRIDVSDHAGGPWEHKAEYYRLAYHFLHEYDFKTELDKTIWTYHAEGISVRNISWTLQKVGIKKMSRHPVWQVVNRLQTEMKKKYGVIK